VPIVVGKAVPRRRGATRRPRPAGPALADAVIEQCNESEVLVLALPPGGVPVVLEVAKRLGAELEIMLVRKPVCRGSRSSLPAPSPVAGSG
jgi:orotate phosphoribosyltransferase-like protein